MTKTDIKNNSYYFTIILVYAFVIAVVYSYWLYTGIAKIWASILLASAIIAIGVVAAFVYVSVASKKKNHSKELESSNINVEKN